MKQITIIITLLCITACVIGCNKSQSPSEQIDKLTTDTKKAGQDMKEYSYAQKDEFVAFMQTRMTALEKDLDKLSATIENSSDQVKGEAKPKLNALREQAAGLNLEIGNVKNATESTWDSVKAGSKKAYAALEDGFQQSRQWVSEKIKP
jgi:archaellum component FlaC